MALVIVSIFIYALFRGPVTCCLKSRNKIGKSSRTNNELAGMSGKRTGSNYSAIWPEGLRRT